MKPFLLTAALALTALTSAAQPILLPEVYAATGVASDDTLNVRAQPNGNSADIGDVYPGQQVEFIALSTDGKWGNTVWHEANGWVSMRFL